MTRAAKEAVSGAARNGPHAGACSSAEWGQPTVDLKYEGRRVRGRFGSTNPRSVPGNRGYWDSTACAPQCILKFPAVPSGKRLVITHVSAQLGLSNDSFVIEGNGGAFFLQKPYQTAEYLDAP